MPIKDKDKRNENARKNYHRRKNKKVCVICQTVFLGKDKEKNCKKHRRKHKRKKKPCLLCNEHRGRNKKYCSKACASKSLKKRVDINCDNCGKLIERCPSLVSKTNFCTKRCFYKYKIDIDLDKLLEACPFKK